MTPRLISCSRCGRIHPVNACPCKRELETKPTAERRFRSTKQWTATSILIRKRDRYLCAACEHMQPPRYTTQRLQVHHIVPIKDAWHKRLDPANLITLCPVCHELAERGDIPAELLRTWAAEANEREGL